MADTTPSQSVIQVSLPEANEITEYHVSSDIPVKLNFYVSEVMFSCDGNDLILTGENGGAIVIKDYLTMGQEGTLPPFELFGGENVPGDIYLFAFSDTEQSIETAGGDPVDPDAEVEAGLLYDEANHGILPTSHDHPAASGLDSSSMLDATTPESHSQLSSDILSYQALFSEYTVDSAASDDAGHETYIPSLFSPSVAGGVDSVPVSFVDSIDPINDLIQHVIDFPDSL
ncbi:hypothetical protein [Pseudodesulfovibrio sediminis]|uniref:Uncharacterized protein n=1 Tax=Pseudodesulfovibrio sediminis TaxID=2810563 RepID=A0ABN6ERF2_9BACT|nr:hypothetical protein [Pseudodesulfovibrio sediminis]BCS87656.1 hypothetical protein PSDVSF_08980 [Pseudodesulfovibrio sediminis]